MAGLAALALGYVLSQLYRSFLAVLTPALTVELGATKADLSLASGAWFIAFALMQFVVGVSLDTVQQIESYLISRNYEGFTGPKGPRIRGRAGGGGRPRG